MSEVPEAIAQYWAAVAAKDLAGAGSFLSDDFVERWPQSGEVIHGASNWIGMASNHPTFPDTRLVRSEGHGELWVSHLTFDYPMKDGTSRFYVCAVQKVRGGKISEIVEYFGAPFDPAEWRTQWVEVGS